MTSWKGRLARCALAHFAAYPIAFLWAVAAIPLAIHLSARDLDALHDDLDAIGHLVVRRLAWPAGVAFALPHAIGVPWAFGRDGDAARARKVTWIGLGALAGLGVAFGGASWLWLLLR